MMVDEEDFNDLKTNVAVLTATVTAWMATTTDYRLQLCQKIDKFTEKVNALPCGERKEWYQSMGRQIGFMWAVLGIFVLAFITLGIKSIAESKDIKVIKAKVIKESADYLY